MISLLLLLLLPLARAQQPQPMPMPPQISLPRVDALNNSLIPYPLLDWQARSQALYAFLFNSSSPAWYVSVFPNVTVQSAAYNGSLLSIVSYLGRTSAAQGPGEALAVAGAVFGAALSHNLPTHDPNLPDPHYILAYLDLNGVAWNNPPGPTAPVVIPTFWYSLINHVFVFTAADALGLQPHDAPLLRAAATAWSFAARAMANNYTHTGFNFQTMQPYDNGIWVEADSAAGVAWIGVVAAEAEQRSGTGSNGTIPLAMARAAVQFLLQQSASPLYETVMPFGALAAARLNAVYNDSFNLTQLLAWSLSDGHNIARPNWGMLNHSSIWGGKFVGGLIGSTNDGGGYGFFGNGAWFLAALSPIPRYQPAYARILAKWMLHLSSASRYYFGDQVDKQSNPGDRWDPGNVVAYEGLRKCDFNRTLRVCVHGQDFGPFATGDWCEAVNCTNITWPCPSPDHPEDACSHGSDRVLYGGAALGVFGAVFAATNVSSVWRIDVRATDAYSVPGHPTFLYYNPSANETVWVEVDGSGGEQAEDKKAPTEWRSQRRCRHGQLVDLWSAGTGALLAAGLVCGQAGAFGLALPPDTAVLVSLAPSGLPARWINGQLWVGGGVVTFGVGRD